MKCKKCQSENLKLIDSGPHKKLVCGDCLAFQKFLSKSEATTFNQIKSDNKSIHSDGEIFDPVCRVCGDPLTTEELACFYCRR